MSKAILEDYVKNLDGYKISNTHFKIGSKIHSSDFFYAKRLFQNSYYTSRLALLLALQIKVKFETKNIQISLVGYEMYSELLLSLVKKFLKDLGYKNINHCTTQDVDGKMKYTPSDFKIKENVAIIVPITSTGSTSTKIGKNLKLLNIKLKEENILQITVLQAYDKNFAGDTPNTLNSLITLQTEWSIPQDCKKCFDNEESKPLYETDKSSLTPTLIFNLPSRAKKLDTGTLSKNFDEVEFQEALIYRRAKRNNEHFLFSTDTDILIENNLNNIQKWLGKVKNTLEIKSTDKIIIISPSHFSNTLFINMVNELVFNSSATIIHHQTDFDFLDNFKLLNQSFLSQQDARIFFVDDSLITGGTFFKLYDLFRYSNEYDKALDGTIFLSNKASADIHKRVSRTVIIKDKEGNEIGNNIFSFVNVNLPSHPKISDKKPLEHEAIRYNQLVDFALHDVVKDDFAFKASKLNGNSNQEQGGQKNSDRHLRMFKATHKVYEYFRDNPHISELNFEDLLISCNFNKDDIEDKMALMKVLCQYPFLLYKPLRNLSFQWHKEWLNSSIKTQKSSLEKNHYTYNEFIELKFLIRRAVFIGNYFITSEEFIELISLVLNYAIKDIKFLTFSLKENNQSNLFIQSESKSVVTKNSLNDDQKLNWQRFHLYLVANYVELFHKNGWTINKVISELQKVENKFTSPQAKQFVRMLKIEASTVLSDFYNILNEKKSWRELYLQDSSTDSTADSAKEQSQKLDTETQRVENYLDKELKETNKFKLADEVLKLQKNEEIIEQFINYLWIKQFLITDQYKKIAKDKKIASGLNEKTEALFAKLKVLFSNNIATELGAFFIVNDGKDHPHLVYDINKDGYALLNELDNEKHNLLFKFMKGEEVSIHNRKDKSDEKIVPKTIVEYTYEVEAETWKDLYALNNESISEELEMDAHNLLLIRIADKKFKTLGLIGFYGSADLHSDLLAKQLLMLLRADIANFIITHHQNDEFSALRQAEAIKRFAYLAGHGRYMMQELAKVNQSLFLPVVKTMEKLQYLFATKFIPHSEYTSDKKKNLEDEIFEIYRQGRCTKKVLEGVVNMGNSIFKSKEVENEVKLQSKISLQDDLDGFQFNFNSEILQFICFELLINAKKNRFHFVNSSCPCGITKNQTSLTFNIEENDLKVIIAGTGPAIPQTLSQSVKKGEKIKRDTEIAGLYLVNKVIKMLNTENKIEIDSAAAPKCEPCGIYINTVTLTLKPHNQ